MNTKGFLIVALFLFNVFFGISQPKLNFKSGPEYDIRLLIVPFDPKIYFNDATAEIARESGESHDEILMYFRYEFNKAINQALMDSCYIVNLLTDNTLEARQDIDGIYTVIGYEWRDAMPNLPEDNSDKKEEGFFEKNFSFRKEGLRKKQKKVESSRIENGEIVSKRQTNENKYLHIYFTEPDVISEIAERRGIDLYLFINQFEIKGVYGTYRSGDRNSIRKIKIHYSIYDNRGLLYFGGIAETSMPFNLYDKEKIAKTHFPEIIRQISRNLNLKDY